MRIIITGVAGFLGSHLALKHLEAGEKVSGIDNFSSSSRHSTHLKQLLKYPNFRFFDDDICRMNHTNYVFNMFKDSHECPNMDPLLIYNFACPASPPIYQSIPMQTTRTCVEGTYNVLELAETFEAKVVHASTSEVYGNPSVKVQSESYHGDVNCYGPRACYDEGKRAAEALCYDYYKKHNLDVRVARIFNTYGPHMDVNDGRVVTNFISQALRNEDITVYGDGLQTRSFCYVSDLIEGIYRLGSLETNPDTPVNIGNPNEFTVWQLAYNVLKLTGSKSKIVYKSLPVDDPMQRCPDITLAKNLLGWEPQVQLEAGLTHTIEYIRNSKK